MKPQAQAGAVGSGPKRHGEGTATPCYLLDSSRPPVLLQGGDSSRVERYLTRVGRPRPQLSLSPPLRIKRKEEPLPWWVVVHRMCAVPAAASAEPLVRAHPVEYWSKEHRLPSKLHAKMVWVHSACESAQSQSSSDGKLGPDHVNDESCINGESIHATSDCKRRSAPS